MVDQHPVNSPFCASTTVDEVVGGVDLAGKRVVITGAHSGLGFETARAMSKAGAQVISGSRNPEHARKALDQINAAISLQLDLSDLTSISAFCNEVAAFGVVDIVINNAGIMAAPLTYVGDRWESHFAINHLGHYAMVCHLWKSISDGGRVVSVSSAGHHTSSIRWEDPFFYNGYDRWLAYGQSKTANALFAVHLNEIGRERGIRAYSVHPGKIFTPLQRHLTQTDMIEAGWIDASGNPKDPTFKTPSQGAATQAWAATSFLLDQVGGVYCEDCNIATIAPVPNAEFAGVRDYAIDPAEADKLWTFSEKLTDIKVAQ